VNSVTAGAQPKWLFISSNVMAEVLSRLMTTKPRLHINQHAHNEILSQKQKPTQNIIIRHDVVCHFV